MNDLVLDDYAELARSPAREVSGSAAQRYTSAGGRSIDTLTCFTSLAIGIASLLERA